jgi:hypothetical protein
MSVDGCAVFPFTVLSEAFAAEPPNSAAAPTANTIAKRFILALHSHDSY